MLSALEYSDTKIIIEHGDLVFIAVVISGDEPEELRDDLRKFIIRIEKDFYDAPHNWKCFLVSVRCRLH